MKTKRTKVGRVGSYESVTYVYNQADVIKALGLPASDYWSIHCDGHNKVSVEHTVWTGDE